MPLFNSLMPATGAAAWKPASKRCLASAVSALWPRPAVRWLRVRLAAGCSDPAVSVGRSVGRSADEQQAPCRRTAEPSLQPTDEATTASARRLKRHAWVRYTRRRPAGRARPRPTATGARGHDYAWCSGGGGGGGGAIAVRHVSGRF